MSHFFVGMDKCGSSWVHRWASLHPEVSARTARDTMPSRLGAAWGAPTDFGVNHDAVHFTKELDVLADIGGVTPILAVRSPIDRALSAWHYMRLQGRYRSILDFSQALREVDELITHSLYGAAYERLVARFSEVLLLDFNELASSPETWNLQLSESLGIQRAELNPVLLSKVNPASKARFPLVNRGGRSLLSGLRRAGLGSVAQAAKDSSVARLMRGKPLSSGDYGVASESDQAFVRSRLLQDVERLDSLTGSNFAFQWFESSAGPVR